MHPTGSNARSRRKPGAGCFGKAAASQQAVLLVGQQLTCVRPIAMVEPDYLEVRVKLQGCGISASDLPVWEGRPWFRYPQEAGAPGHEGWGFIDAVGAGVDGGFVGLLLTQLAADRGAHAIVLSRQPFELECAESMEAEESVLIRADGSDAERALRTNGGAGFDRVIETAGTQFALDLAKQLCAERACLVTAGDICGDPRDRYIKGVQRAIQAALEGRLDPFPLISHSVSMRSLDRGFELTRERPEGFVKAVLIHES